jgi:chromosome segregation ATPase
MRKIAVALLLVAASCRKGPDPEIARLNGVIGSLRQQLAAKEKENEDLRAELSGKTAYAETLTKYVEELNGVAEGLQKGLEAKGKEALDAISKAGDLEKRLAGASAMLEETKTALLKRTADLDALKAELANLKKLLVK